MKNIIISFTLFFICFIIPSKLDAATCNDNYNSIQHELNIWAYETGSECESDMCVNGVEALWTYASVQNYQLLAACCITHPFSC